jgi:hypothetical protein
MAELGFVPMFFERINIGNSEKTLRGIRQERLAGSALMIGSNPNASQQQKASNTARHVYQEAGH